MNGSDISRLPSELLDLRELFLLDSEGNMYIRKHFPRLVRQKGSEDDAKFIFDLTEAFDDDGIPSYSGDLLFKRTTGERWRYYILEPCLPSIYLEGQINITDYETGASDVNSGISFSNWKIEELPTIRAGLRFTVDSGEVTAGKYGIRADAHDGDNSVTSAWIESNKTDQWLDFYIDINMRRVKISFDGTTKSASFATLNMPVLYTIFGGHRASAGSADRSITAELQNIKLW